MQRRTVSSMLTQGWRGRHAERYPARLAMRPDTSGPPSTSDGISGHRKKYKNRTGVNRTANTAALLNAYQVRSYVTTVLSRGQRRPNYVDH